MLWMPYGEVDPCSREYVAAVAVAVASVVLLRRVRERPMRQQLDLEEYLRSSTERVQGRLAVKRRFGYRPPSRFSCDAVTGPSWIEKRLKSSARWREAVVTLSYPRHLVAMVRGGSTAARRGGAGTAGLSNRGWPNPNDAAPRGARFDAQGLAAPKGCPAGHAPKGPNGSLSLKCFGPQRLFVYSSDLSPKARRFFSRCGKLMYW